MRESKGAGASAGPWKQEGLSQVGYPSGAERSIPRDSSYHKASAVAAAASAGSAGAVASAPVSTSPSVTSGFPSSNTNGFLNVYSVAHRPASAEPSGVS